MLCFVSEIIFSFLLMFVALMSSVIFYLQKLIALQYITIIFVTNKKTEICNCNYIPQCNFFGNIIIHSKNLSIELLIIYHLIRSRGRTKLMYISTPAL